MKSTLLKLISAASITATFSLLGSLPASAQGTENLSASARAIETNRREVKTLSLMPNLEVAQSTSENSIEEAVTPFSLVSLAEEGRFKEQGIPGAGSLPNLTLRLTNLLLILGQFCDNFWFWRFIGSFG